MPAMAMEAAPPPGFEVVKSTAPTTVEPVKPKAPEPPAKAAEPVIEAAPEQAEPAAEVAAEPTAFDKAKQAADAAKKGAAQNRRLREQGLQLQQQLDQQARNNAHLESQLRQATQHLEHVISDPLGFMKTRGLSAQELAKRAALEGSPEGQIEALRAELKTTQDELRSQVEAGRAREEATRRAQIENEYKQEAQNAKKYPNLASVHPDFVLARTKEIVAELWRQHARDPHRFQRTTGFSSPGEIPSHHFLDYINGSYAPKPAAPKQVAEEAAPDTSGKKTTTITNKLASAKHAAPTDFSKMSDREQRKAMAQQFRDLGLGR